MLRINVTFALLLAAAQVGAAGPVTQPAQPTVAQLLGQGRTAALAGDRFAALRAFGAARALAPDNADAARGVADMLAELGAPYGAAAAMGHADAGLRARQAALMVRWGHQLPQPDAKRRYGDTDAAIAALQALLAEASAQTPQDTGLVIRLLRDLAVAKRDRKRWAEVLTTTQALRDRGDAVPAYVRQAEADALLALRQPHAARLAYAEVLATDPQNQDAVNGRIYAELEDEDPFAAIASADALAASIPPVKTFGKDQKREVNPDWFDAHVLASQVHSYADLPAIAWDRLLPLAEGAPANASVRAALGDVAAQRGWPRRSAEETAIAYSLAPDGEWTQAQSVQSDIRRKQWKRAQQALEALRSTYGDELPVQRAQR